MTERTIEGVVMRSHEKTITTVKGPTQVYSLLMNTSNGEEWYSFGFSKPTAVINQHVKFTVTQNGQYWNADNKTLEVLPDVEIAAPQVVAKAVAQVDNRQRSIVYQSAYERAIMIIDGAITHGAISLPTKKADKFDAYRELIHNTALELAAIFIAPPADFIEAEVQAVDVTQVAPGPESEYKDAVV